jgi:hypothetical protein
MKKIYTLFILFYVINLNNIYGQHSWVVTTVEEKDESLAIFLSARKKIVSSYKLVKNIDGISYVLEINTKTTLLEVKVFNPEDFLAPPRVANSKELEDLSNKESVRNFYGLGAKQQTLFINRVQVRDTEPNFLDWYPHKFGGATFETGPCRYYEICRINGSFNKIVIRWLRNPIYLADKVWVMELLFLSSNFDDIGGTDDIHSLVDNAVIFRKENN